MESSVRYIVREFYFHLFCDFHSIDIIIQNLKCIFLCFLLCRYILIGGKECEFKSSFQLILHTKLANPHFPPEVQAQTTLINFTVTPVGLEEQLLGQVVSKERPDLEALKVHFAPHQGF